MGTKWSPAYTNNVYSSSYLTCSQPVLGCSSELSGALTLVGIIIPPRQSRNYKYRWPLQTLDSALGLHTDGRHGHHLLTAHLTNDAISHFKRPIACSQQWTATTLGARPLLTDMGTTTNWEDFGLCEPSCNKSGNRCGGFGLVLVVV